MDLVIRHSIWIVATLAALATTRLCAQQPSVNQSYGANPVSDAVEGDFERVEAEESQSSKSAQAPKNPYLGGLVTRQRMTGDWMGARSELAERGLTFDLFLTQFYQRIASGGQEQAWEYGGKIDYLGNLDAQKLGLLDGLFVNMHAETRYGTDVNSIDGLIAPSNISMNFPEPNRHLTSVTGLKFTQVLTETFAVYGGKINTLDEYPLRYSPGLGTNKPGLEGFMNTSLVFNPIAARTVPYSAFGVGAAVLQNGEPLFTFTAFDPEERATTGLENLYGRGVMLMPDLVLRGKLFDRPSIVNVGGTWSSAEYRSFDPAAYLSIIQQVLAGNAADIVDSPVEHGSWSLYTNVYHALWVDAADEKRSWGLFGQFGVSDGNPNPIRFVANAGLGGRSMRPGRNLDTWGAGFFYMGLSSNFKTLARPFVPQRDEYGVELFYNYALTPWCRLTGDIQIARPSTVAFDPVVITGLRLQLLF